MPSVSTGGGAPSSQRAWTPSSTSLVAKEVVEAVKKFRILERRLDHDDGELTPALKVRRRAIEEEYGKLIESMY